MNDAVHGARYGVFCRAGTDSSLTEIAGDSPDDHLNWLIPRLEPGDEVDFVWWSQRGLGGPVLKHEAIRALADLRCSLRFDLRFAFATAVKATWASVPIAGDVGANKVAVELYLFLGSHHPNDVSLFLGVQPTSFRVKGVPITGAHSGRTFVPSESIWEFHSDRMIQSKQLSDHLDWLTKHIARDLRPLLRRSRISYKFKIFWISQAGHGGPVLSPQELDRLATLGVDVSFDFAWMDEGADDG